MIPQGSKIAIPKIGVVTLVSLEETPKGFWTLLVESDDGSQRSEVLSNEVMDGITVLEDQNPSKRKSVTGRLLAFKGFQGFTLRTVVISAGVMAALLAVLIVALPNGDSGTTEENGVTKLVDEFTTDGEVDGRLFGEESLGLNWKVVSGYWDIKSGKLLSTQGMQPSIAVLSLDSMPKSFEVDFQEVTQLSGIVFLYADDLNYWKLVAMPDFATWNVYKVKDGGEPIFKGNTGFTFQENVKVSVALSQQELKVLVNGEQRLSIPLSGVSNQNSVGLLQRGRIAGSTSGGKFIVDSLSVGIIVDSLSVGIS